MRRVVLASVLACGCSNILGLGDPKHRGDAGVGSAAPRVVTLAGLTAVGPDDTTSSAFHILDPRLDGFEAICAGSGSARLCLVGGITP
jgi:hypothetical protein